MTVPVEAANSSEHEFRVGRAEIECLLDFWRGKSPNFAPVISDGLEYIARLTEAEKLSFTEYMTHPHNLRALINDATNELHAMVNTDYEKYRKWLEGHPEEISILHRGEWKWVTDVAVVNYGIYPLMADEMVTESVEVRWIDEETDDAHD